MIPLGSNTDVDGSTTFRSNDIIKRDTKGNLLPLGNNLRVLGLIDNVVSRLLKWAGNPSGEKKKKKKP